MDVPSIKEFFPGLFDPLVQEVELAGPTTPANKKYDPILFRGFQLKESKIESMALTDHYPVIAEFKTSDE